MNPSVTHQTRIIEPIVLGNLSLDGEAVRGENGDYLLKTQPDWMSYLAALGKRLPTLPECFTFIHHLQKENPPASEGLLQDLQKNGLVVGTIFGYSQNNNTITHFGDEPRVIPCTIPEGAGYLDELVKYDAWRKVVQNAFEHQDVKEVVKVLQDFSGKRSYIWTALAGSRKSTPERAAWFGCNGDGLNLIGYYDLSSNSAARGVRRIGAAAGGAPRAENGVPYRTSAISEEKRLEEGIREALFPLSKYVGTFGQEHFNQEREQAVKDILELCSK